MAASSSLRAIATSGALLAAIGIALATVASHGLDDAHARERLGMAALFAFGHGVGLVALARGGYARGLVCAGAVLLLGTVLFAGSLAGAVFFGWPTMLAPVGGTMLIVGWILAAIALARG